jgi:hypothetical protein
MARTLAPDLAAALPALVLWVRVTQARLEVLEQRYAALEAAQVDCPGAPC